MSNVPFPHISPPSSKAGPQGGGLASQHAASYYFTIYLVFACAGLSVTSRWAGNIERLDTRSTTRSTTYHNRVVCNLVYLPPVLSLATVVINIAILSGLHIIRNPARGSRYIPTAGPEAALVGGGEEGNDSLVGGGVAEDGTTFIPSWLSPRMSLFIGMWVLCAVFALTNTLLEISPGTTWEGDEAGGWLMVMLLALVQVWMLSAAAFIDRNRGFHGVDPFLSGQLPTPMNKIRGRLLVSLVMLSISFVFSESHFPLLRLLLATSLFDMGILYAINAHEITTRHKKPSYHLPLSGEGSGQPVSPAHPIASPRRAFFVTLSVGALLLAVLWATWGTLTSVAEVLKTFDDLKPEREVMQIPTNVLPKREYALWGFLEAGVDIWQGLTLGRVAVYAWRVRNCGKGQTGEAAIREP